MAVDMDSLLKLAESSGAIGQVAEMIGVDEKAAESAVETVVPLLLKGMQGQLNNKDTKEGFLQALNDHSKEDTKDLKKAVKNADTEDGAKIVNHLLGSKQEEVAAKAKKKSGLDTKTILRIMAILAPILMSRMGKSAGKESEKSGSGDLAGVVSGLLDGIDADDVIKIVGLLKK